MIVGYYMQRHRVSSFLDDVHSNHQWWISQR